MMATLKAELRDILKRYDISPTDKSKLWDCHGTLVLYHKAYEIIAAQENIKFDPPVVIEASGEKKIVALLVVGHMGERTEWSIGEAAPGNSKNSYPYAMAEKRAKDRVIGKLAGLAQYVLSEDEADDFKTGERQAVQEPPAEPRQSAPASEVAAPRQSRTKAEHPRRAEALEAYGRIRKALDEAETLKLVRDIVKVSAAELQLIKEVHAPSYEQLMQLASARETEFVAAA